MCLHNDFKDTHLISRDIVAQMIESENIYAKNVRHKSEPIKNANERSEKKIGWSFAHKNARKIV